MAQTKRKRRTTKHRGNAAGIVESRGRTGRPLTTAEKKGNDPKSRDRLAKLDNPPTWQGAAQRSAIASLLLIVIVYFLFDRPIGAVVSIGLVAFAMYIPLGYYTDKWIYDRRQRNKLKKKA